MTGRAIVLQGDALNLPLPDESVDLIVTSPPYFALRSYQDDGKHYDGQIGSEPTPQAFLEALWKATAEMKRVLKPSGSIFVNLGDKYSQRPGQNLARGSGGALTGTKHDVAFLNKTNDEPTYGAPPKSLMLLPHRYAIGCIDQLGLIVRQDQVWSKPNGLPESVTDRTRRSHEYWFHMVKSPRYFSAVDEIREPQDSIGRKQGGPNGRAFVETLHEGRVERTDRNLILNPLGKLPGSVWTIATEPLKVPAELGIDHFAAFPTEWPRRLILGWSPSGVCVECGEGLRPTSARVITGDRGGRKFNVLTPDSTTAKLGMESHHTITGYACECNELIASPVSSGGGVIDPSLVTGRAGFNRPRGATEGRRIITRWEQRHYADQLRHSAHRAEMAAEAGTAFDHYIRTDRSGARPIPPDLLELWHDRGWLQTPPPFVPPPTRPAVVLDPFGGTGTTALVAKTLGRVGISVDLSHDYCRLARWRVNESGHGRKALGRTWAERQEGLAL